MSWKHCCTLRRSSSTMMTGAGYWATKILFLEMSPAMLSNEMLPLLPAKSTVLTLNVNDFADPATLAQVRAVRAEGFGISLRGADLKTQGKLLSDVSCVEVRFFPAAISRPRPGLMRR
ncbi:hypothetical protein ACFS07_22650 [Undibacterium arcticum]